MVELFYEVKNRKPWRLILDRGFGKLRYSAMKKALEDFRKLSNNPESIAELMISHVEYGVEFTNEYGDIDEKFYIKFLESNYGEKKKQYLVFSNSFCIAGRHFL